MRTYTTWRTALVTAIAGSAILAAGPPSVAAQATGTIQGVVRDATSLRPLLGAQVYIQGAAGVLSRDGGVFTLSNVPAGTHEVRAEMIGYATASEEVTIQAGDVVQVTLSLRERAVALDEILVTGTPGATQRRAIGTSIASIDVERMLQTAPVTSMTDVLQGRDPGLTMFNSSGTVGGMGQLLLRGHTSVTRGNAPLVYIDGVQVSTGTSALSSGGQQVSRLNDINPSDVERVEVIKGAAATTLYGSEASNGVIQIFTKQGRGEAVVYNVRAQVGANRIPATFPLMHPDPQYPSANDLLSTGLYQEFSASMRGTSGMLNYFVSGSFMDNEGSFPENWQKRAGARVNLGIAPHPSLTLNVNSSFNWTDTQIPRNDNVIYGVLTTLLLGNPVTRGTEEDPWGGAFIPVPYAVSLTNQELVFRYIGGVTANHRIGEHLNQRLTVGIDLIDRNTINVFPYAPNNYFPEGQRSRSQSDGLFTNVDYAATWTQQLSDRIESQTSAGGQVTLRRSRSVSASGRDFAAPGLELIPSTAVISGGEGLSRSASGGLFLQQQFAFRDRLYLTGGVRMDGASAFGEDFSTATYPKVSLSYVISEEDWFDIPWITTLRLRTGYGQAGLLPGAFAALPSYSPFRGVHTQVAIRHNNLGNPDLGPEVSTEIEGGFEAGLFDDRLDLSTTFYAQTTRDLLLNAPPPPSTGYTANVAMNLGEVTNRGVELSGTLRLIQRPTFLWSVNAGYSYNRNEVTEMGGRPTIQIDRFGTRVVEGYPISSKWERVTVGYDENGRAIISDTAHYLGEGVPPHTGNVGTSVTLGNVSITANAQYAAGQILSNLVSPYMFSRRTGEEYWVFVDEVGGGDPDHPAVANEVFRQGIAFGDFYHRSDWLKLREISVSYPIPSGFLGVPIRSAQIFASGRNLVTWTKYDGTDPELTSTASTGLSIGSDYFTVPQARHFRFGLDVSF